MFLFTISKYPSQCYENVTSVIFKLCLDFQMDTSLDTTESSSNQSEQENVLLYVIEQLKNL